MVEGREETAIAVIWVTDGMDRCRVGFLPCHMVKHAARYEGSLATRQNGGCTTRIGGGCCPTTIISCLSAVSRAKGEGKDNDDIGEEMAKRKHVI